MQIQGDYHPHSGQGYVPEHKHHITKCLYEEEHARAQAGASAMKNSAISRASEENGTLDSFYGYESGMRRPAGAGKGKPGFIREFWDSLGDESEDGREQVLPFKEEDRRNSQMSPAGISALASAVRSVPSFVLAKAENVREKIKTGIGTALKRFGKREDAFGALTNPGSYFEGKRKGKEGFSEKTGKGTRQAAQELITATVSDSHLMDSYSKTGQYCRLNENLTYQKEK